MSTPSSENRTALRWLLLGLVTATLITLSKLWLSLVLAAWFAALTRPLTGRLARVLGGRPRVAAFLTVVSLLLLLVPLVGACIALGLDGVDFVQKIASSEADRHRLVRLVSDKPDAGKLPSFSLDGLLGLAKQYGAAAWKGLSSFAAKAATVLVGLFMFLLGAYTFLIRGDEFWRWLEMRSPIGPQPMRRLAAAFHETGRGLFIGVGLTGLLQGVVATVAYLALKIPSALVLGILTTVASLIPSVRTALVWIPVAGGLALSGRWSAAGILTTVGVLVIGTVDNLIRPVFARYDQLKLPTYVLFLSIFGGLALYGAAGIILRPLLLRLGVEALDIAREQGFTAHASEDSTASESPHPPAPPSPPPHKEDSLKNQH